ncbi:condensation domain-containing protein, partial [Micromonospora sp. NPDC005291]|uniref:condensation domain-containing protein n=1 Tax=Micromonospora sp. NPDC005291 TaxID=3156872 RepID=UPI0033B20B7A
MRIDLEGHGREDLHPDLDLTRTVGWFTTISPLRLPVGDLRTVKEHLRRRPRNGIGYGLLTRAHPALTATPAQISFNHLGEVQETLAGSEVTGADVGPENERRYLIDVVSRVQDGELILQWTYHPDVHRPETIERVARDMTEALRRLVEDARRDDVDNYSPSDLPASALSQAEIDALREHPSWHGSGLVRPLEDCYPQTPLQQGLWFQSQYAQGQGLYHVQVVLRVDQQLDSALFRRSWAEVMRRHSILRTSFWSVPGHEPLQLVWRDIPVPLTEQDWRDEPVEARLADHLRQDRDRGFEPHENPQWRILLARTGDDAYQVVLSAHHTILDGWSNSQLLAEVAECYDALVHDRRPDLHPVRPYRDYVTWLTEQDMDQAERYWRDVLDGVGQATALSVEKKPEPRPEGVPPEIVTALAGVELDEDESAALQEMAQQHHLTLNTVLQSCWALLLSRYSRSDDVVFGTVVSGRPPEFEGAERMVGLFINTLPVRVRVPGGAGWLDWCRELQEQNTRTRQYEYSPLLQVQKWSDIPAEGELFETLFVFENYPVESRPDSALSFSVVDAEERTHFPLNVVINPGKRLGISILYDSQRFDRTVVEDMLTHLRQLCLSVIASPRQQLAVIPMLPGSERERLVGEWSRSGSGSLFSGFWHELFV